MRYFAILTLSVIIFSSCSKNLIPYTSELKEENNWDNRDVQRIQFYTSEDIVLQRKVEEGSTRIESGKIKVVDDKEVEEIVIRKGTRGVAVIFPDGERIGVSFEIDDDHFLTFGPNPKKGDKFFLFASEWNNKVGRVTYNDVSYYTSPLSSSVYLVVDMKKIKDWKIDQRAAGGRKVD